MPEDLELRPINRIGLQQALERWFSSEFRDRITKIQLYRGPYGAKGSPEQNWLPDDLEGCDPEGFLEDLFPPDRMLEPQRWTVVCHLSRENDVDARELRHANVQKRTRPRAPEVEAGPVNTALGSLLEKQTGAISQGARDLQGKFLDVVDARLDEAREAYEQRRDVEDEYGVDLKEAHDKIHDLELTALRAELTGGFWTPEARAKVLDRGLDLADRLLVALSMPRSAPAEPRGKDVQLLALRERADAQEQLIQQLLTSQAALTESVGRLVERLAPTDVGPQKRKGQNLTT